MELRYATAGQREVLKHCPANNSTTAFAVVTDDGSFYKLDDAGNTKVTSLSGTVESDKQKKTLKNMRVTGSGTVQADTLKVGWLSKSDKPLRRVLDQERNRAHQYYAIPPADSSTAPNPPTPDPLPS